MSLRAPRVLILLGGWAFCWLLLPMWSSSVAKATGGFSLRFYGNGGGEIDRVKILAEGRSINAGGDFTLEWWMKAAQVENTSSACRSGAGDLWIFGNILFDRDIFGPGDYGDYGVSLAGGRIAFGVNQGGNGFTLCSDRTVADGQWHHIAVTRRASDGQMRIFVDGRLDAEGTGPTGDIRYRDGRPTSYPNDPYLVIGAEKHGVDHDTYPSYSGWVDEVRLSRIVRYYGLFSPPTAPFTPDADTLALYHFDEGPEGDYGHGDRCHGP
ncbi:MAG: LamG domain-containing protein [Anaerolineae bacterium]|nr:LamG domain-containing protein [Anaerolineae bacterium]